MCTQWLTSLSWCHSLKNSSAPGHGTRTRSLPHSAVASPCPQPPKPAFCMSLWPTDRKSTTERSNWILQRNRRTKHLVTEIPWNLKVEVFERKKTQTNKSVLGGKKNPQMYLLLSAWLRTDVIEFTHQWICIVAAKPPSLGDRWKYIVLPNKPGAIINTRQKSLHSGQTLATPGL